ncbi:hypothetical protein MIH18_03480 [Marinobacter sp. M3C]|jgi:hypothetical protein|uniref:hypothetical protein n=1 Tax=Marinobacter sp. M3C TaxID=2917715 RepID=UPI00200E316C|nr:hypothetical protein [Marinobacter sp. M3C]MCL1487563.1 hypothetical protein [Marinobacter sp.]UQG61025.1 hypothetical protein MIH18_03480 [Marinobacter sp. M3C]
MSGNFAKKTKPSAQEYLNASLEEIVERANQNPNESEIPFVTALLSAKASRDQKAASNRMFWIALATTLIAVLSLVNSYYSNQKASTYEVKIGYLEDKIDGFEGHIQSVTAKLYQLKRKQEDILLSQEEIQQNISKLSESQRPRSSRQTKHNQ